MIAALNIVLFIAYVLIYAAIHQGGRYAYRPLDTLRVPLRGPAAQASTKSGSGGATHGGGGGVVGTVKTIGKWVLRIAFPFL